MEIHSFHVSGSAACRYYFTIFWPKTGVKIKKMNKWSGDISKLHLHTEFQENRPIRLVSSDVQRTQTRTEILSKPLFWSQGTSKQIILLKSQSRVFYHHNIFSIHTVYGRK